MRRVALLALLLLLAPMARAQNVTTPGLPDALALSAAGASVSITTASVSASVAGPVPVGLAVDTRAARPLTIAVSLPNATALLSAPSAPALPTNASAPGGREPARFGEWRSAAPSATSAAPGTAAGPRPPPSGLATMTATDAVPVDGGTTITVAVATTAVLAAAARLYSRFQRHQLLDDPSRRRLAELLAATPGLSTAELAATLGMSRGAVVHHARMLEKHGILASRHDGLHRRFWPTDRRIETVERRPTPGEERVLDALRGAPLTQHELAGRLGVTPQAVSYHLTRLRSAGRVDERLDGHLRRWSAVESDQQLT